MAPVRIRLCTQTDLAVVVQLERLWEQENIAYGDFPMSQDAFLESLLRFPAYFFVAESDGQIVGYIHGSLQHQLRVEVLPEQAAYVEIENLYVRPEFRNSAVGSALLERLLAVARQEGIARFVVDTTSKETDRILRFYRSHGFTPWKIQFFQ
jgi:ribosomal protein S18 acetylase RimI-like enzyme